MFLNRRKRNDSFALARAMGITLLLFLNAACQAGSLADLARPHEGRSMRETSTHKIGPDGKFDPNGKPDPGSNWDNKNVAPGKTKVLMDVSGPGMVTHLWMTFLGPEPHTWARRGSATHQDMLLRVYYDGRQRPGIEAPVGDFFANAFGKRAEVISEPVVVEDADSYNCFWRMPFRKSIRMEIVNQGTRPISLLYYNVDWIKKDSLPDDTPYFHAQYRQEYPVQNGRDYTLLETTGKGHYVGTVLSVRMRSPAWFGEGDEKIYIDGEKEASIWGTGTEDYFLSAWGLKTVLTPYFGVPYFDRSGIGGHTSSYRWHIQDPIVFEKGIKVTIEHYGWMSKDENPDYREHSWNEREDDYSSVAYWYQTGEPTFSARAPDARQRRLPNLDLITPANNPKAPPLMGDGSAKFHSSGVYPTGHMLYMPKSQENAWVEIAFDVEKREPRHLLVRLLKSYDYGRYQAYLNGVPIGRVIDLYGDKTESEELHLLDFWPDPGKYKLRLKCVGKKPRSQGYYLGVESVRLRERRPRVAEYAHDKEKDWKTKPLLYR